MLVLSRRIGEQILLPTCDVTVTVIGVRGKNVRLGFSAPSQVTVQRAELLAARPDPGESAVPHTPHPPPGT